MITDFQLSLLAAGGVFVVGVISYNKWQEYKLKKRVERAFDGQHDDVLMRTDGGARAEPSFHMDDVPMPDAGSGAYGVPEHMGGHVGAVTAPGILPDDEAGATAAAAVAGAPVRSADADGVRVQTGAGVLCLTELQRAGGKRLAVADFLRGIPLSAGARLGRTQP